MVPVKPPEKLMAEVFVPLHLVWLFTWLTVGVGRTLIVKVTGVPVQTPASGVTVMLAERLVLPAFTGVKIIFPVPLAGRPIAGLVLVHEKLVP